MLYKIPNLYGTFSESVAFDIVFPSILNEMRAMFKNH